MKRLLFLILILMSILIYRTAFAAEPEVGKKFVFQGRIGKQDKVDIIEDERFKRYISFVHAKNARFAPMEVLYCVQRAQRTKGHVKVTAEVTEMNDTWIHLNYHTATCENIK
jgi:hypothetical protein